VAEIPRTETTRTRGALGESGTIMIGRYRLLQCIGEGAWEKSGRRGRKSPSSAVWR
jgi:hypothetical protein